MADLLLTKLTSKSFDTNAYVRGLTLNSVSIQELLTDRERIQKLSEETNGLLKKNVYKNYTQFIDTAKEISYLESEMYQLSHMLTEQQDILNSVLDVAIASEKSSDPLETNAETVEDNKKKLTTLLEKVEGCAPVLEYKSRTVVLCGELIELSLSEFRPLQRLYCILLNDSFMIARKNERKRGPISYRFETIYELDSLAVVDVKDDTSIKNVFKVLVFPDSRLFQCQSPNSKSEWLSAVEQAKKKRMSIFRRKSSLMNDYHNPFEDEDDGVVVNPFDDENGDHVIGMQNDNEFKMPNWLFELPEDLDVYIAQREFEKAVTLIHKANLHFASVPKSVGIKEMRLKVDQRTKQLINILENELKISPERSIHSGPRAARRAVSVLLSLEKSSMACNLFLKHRSAILKQSLKHQTMGGDTATYMEQLCMVFFGGIIEAGKEFTKAFETNNSCASSFIVWAKKELQNFVQIFSRHVFTPQITASVSAECISSARIHCNRLPEIGLDLSFELNYLLQSYVERLVTEIRSKLLEAIKLKANDDKWKPQNYQNINNIQKFLEDMKDIGLENMDSYVYDDVWVSLTANTISFGKMYLNFVDDLLKLYSPTVHILVNDALFVSFQSQIAHIASAFQNASDASDRQFISKNASFLNESILPLAAKHYLGKLGLMFPRMADLRSELTKYCPSGKTSISKYSSTVFV